MKHSLEVVYKIFNDENGSYVQVSPDADGLNCIDIAYVPASGKYPQERLTLNKDEVKLLIEALQKSIT